MSNQGIFQRYEKKYLLTSRQYQYLFERLESRIQPDQYGKSAICNLYFDTPDFRMIRASLSGPVYKEKLRLRSYGVPQEDSTVFVELKKKFEGVVYKRRVGMTLKQAKRYLIGRRLMIEPCQITREIDWTMSYYEALKARMYIAYDRTAYYGIDDPDFRITFDRNIIWRNEALALSHGIWGQQLLEDDQILMEIKIPGAYPKWLTEELTALALHPTSFSKYGSAYQALHQEAKREQGGVSPCLTAFSAVS